MGRLNRKLSKVLCEKNICNNPKLDLVNVNTYIKFGEILSTCSQDIEWKQSFGVNQGQNSCTNLRKMACNNSKLDLVKINAYIKFGEILSNCSQDIERKHNFGANQGP